MLTKNETGRMGENAVCEYLEKTGFVVINRNYRVRGGEIDIIAKNDQFVTFVEVKTRAAGSIVSGVEAVDIRKQRRTFKTAVAWLSDFPTKLQPRFDVAEIITEKVGSENIIKLNYIADAFGGEVCCEFF